MTLYMTSARFLSVGRVTDPLIASGRKRALFLVGVAVLLLAAMALVPLALVTVKMLASSSGLL